MEAGRLNHLIDIECQTASKDADIGEDVLAWTLYAQSWAAVAPLSARELSRVRAFSSEITTQFEIRYLAGIDNTMRIKMSFESPVFDTLGNRLMDVEGAWLVVNDFKYYSISEIIQPYRNRRSLTLLAFSEQPVT